MKTKYYYITYSALVNGSRVFKHTVYSGSLVNWIKEHLSDPRSVRLNNQVELTKEEYEEIYKELS